MPIIMLAFRMWLAGVRLAASDSGSAQRSARYSSITVPRLSSTLARKQGLPDWETFCKSLHTQGFNPRANLRHSIVTNRVVFFFGCFFWFHLIPSPHCQADELDGLVLVQEPKVIAGDSQQRC